MRNEIAKQIVNCRSGKEGVKRILNGVSPTDGTMGGETPIFAASETLWSDIYGSHSGSNSLYDALNHVKVSRMFVQLTNDGERDYDFVPRQWLKDSSMGYQQVIADFGWSDPVAELPEGVESSGDKSDDELEWGNEGKWYEETTGEGEAEETLYYQVIVTDLYWGIDPGFLSDLNLPEDTEYLTYEQLESIDMTNYIEGPKDDSDLVEDYMFQYWFYDPSVFKKKLQEMCLMPVNINTALIYKQLDVTQEDIDDLNDSGEYADFVEWVNYELRKNVEDAIIAYMLGSNVVDPINNEPLIDTDAIYRFTEDTIDDRFTYLDVYIDETGLVKGLTQLSSNINADRKWLVINPDALQKALDEMGPTADKYSLAARIGVDYVYVTCLCPNEQAIILDPDEMWLREKNVINTAYPVYDNNKVNMLYEINCGIKPHRAWSTALLTDITYE